MTQGITDRYWQAEARTQETKQLIRDIKRITRRKFTAEEKIRIVLEGFRRDTPIRDLCRREGICPSTYYAWLKIPPQAFSASAKYLPSILTEP
jgi:hypothetical protein